MSVFGATDPATRPRLVVFGLTVRTYRKALGLSQEELAERAGVDRQTVCRVETAACATDIPTAFHLADALGVSPEALFAAQPPDLPPLR